MPNARVSVVITTYNRAHLVTRALESVLRQTYPDVEIIVVDDGSTDDTTEVIERVTTRYDRPVRYFRKENGGCASARNLGATHATSPWLLFLDSDDLLEPGAVDALVRVLASSGADFVYSPAVEVDARGEARTNPPVAAGRPENFAVEHFTNTNVRPGAWMLRTADFHDLGGFDESFSHNEDSDFVQRLAIRRRACYSPVPSVRHHEHAGSKSSDRVAIYRALLASSEHILASEPDFAAILGERASERIIELRTSLAEAQILAGRFDDARQVLAQGRSRLGSVAHLALFVGSPAPLRARLAFGLQARAFRAALRRRLGAFAR